ARTAEKAVIGAADPAPLPPLTGVPIPIKDLNMVAGVRQTFGSVVFADNIAPQDDNVTSKIRAAGAVIIGKTAAPEFGLPCYTEGEIGPPARTPWDLNRSAGGSSGGAGAAVSSGLAPAAHGNDGGGSIRIPAACTGLVGLKAARDRVPAEVPGWLGASVEGVVTRTVEDAAAVLDEICGPDPLAWHTAAPPDRPFAAEVGADPGRLRVALMAQAPFGVPVDHAAAQAVRDAGRALEDLGHHVEEAGFELFPPEVLEPFLAVMHAGFGDYDGLDVERLEPHNRAGLRAGRAVDSVELVRALGTLQRLSRRTVARWGRDLDVLVTPTTAILPPEAGSILEQVHAHPEDMPADVLSMSIFTAPFNVSGQPAASLPLGEARPDGGPALPVGVQLVTGPWQEALLIRLASQLEEAFPWRHRHPSP
ncbi:MAG: amidase, partial [Acidimicrobiales bacterium]